MDNELSIDEYFNKLVKFDDILSLNTCTWWLEVGSCYSPGPRNLRIQNTHSMNPVFVLKIEPKLEDWFLKLEGVFPWVGTAEDW